MRLPDNYDDLLAASPRIRKMPRDVRGLPIPFVVLRDKQGKPNFIVNDTMVVHQCVSQGVCSICGGRMKDDDVWFLGGEGSGLDPCGVYNDPPVHHECGTFALQVCPYLAIRRHKGMKPEVRESMLEGLLETSEALGFEDRTVSEAKPPTYILGRATGYSRTPDHLLPNRPFASIEEWCDGEMVGSAIEGQPGHAEGLAAYRQRGLDRLKERGLHFLTLPAHFQRAWSDGHKGQFPWTGRR